MNWSSPVTFVLGAAALCGVAQAQLAPLSWSVHETVTDPGADAGWSVATGDVNGDGYADAIVGAPHGDPGLVVDAGRVLVRFGPAFVAEQTLVAPAAQMSADFGYAVACGDVNGDGFADVLVGEPDTQIGLALDVGRAYVFFGPTLTTSVTLNQPVAQAGADFGQAVAIADLTGDGIGDAIVGAPEAKLGAVTSGQVYVYAGPTLGTVTTVNDPNAAAGAHFGWSVAAGDTDADGKQDLVVGIPDGAVGASIEAGRIRVFLGPGLATSILVVEPTTEVGANYGTTVACGDVNGDGRADIATGIPDAKALGINDSGEAAVAFGPTFTSQIVVREPSVELGADFGASVALGDTNGDGFADLCVGASDATAATLTDAGEAFLFLGPGLTAASNLVPEPINLGDDYGYSAAMGDFNGDGLMDPIVGAKDGVPVGANHVGRAFAFIEHTNFGLSTLQLSGSAGGLVTMNLKRSAADAGRPYAVLGTIGGDSPCFPIGSVCLPIAIHPVITPFLLTPGVVPNSIGVLDATGGAAAFVFAPAGVAAPAVGLKFTFAWLVVDDYDFASRPVVFEIAP